MVPSQPEALAMPLAAKLTINGAAVSSRIRTKREAQPDDGMASSLEPAAQGGLAGTLTTRPPVARAPLRSAIASAGIEPAVIERAAGNRAFELFRARLEQRAYVSDRGEPAGSDHRN